MIFQHCIFDSLLHSHKLFHPSQVGPASKAVSSQAELDAVLEKPDVVVVSYLQDKSDQEKFQKTASSLRENVAFAHFTG